MPEPVTLDQAKAQCRAEGTTADDTYLDGLITAARVHVEQYCGVKLVAESVAMSFASFAALERLTIAPIADPATAVVKYLDSAGVLQTLDPSVYELVNVDADPLRPRIRLAFGQSWPAVRAAEDAVQVTATAGYADVPAPIVQAMLLLIGQWYDNRSATAVDARSMPSDMPNAVPALLANYRR